MRTRGKSHHLRLLPMRTQQMYAVGSLLFNSWDTKTAAHRTAMESQYALMGDELFQAESTEFDAWCVARGVY